MPAQVLLSLAYPKSNYGAYVLVNKSNQVSQESAFKACSEDC